VPVRLKRRPKPGKSKGCPLNVGPFGGIRRATTRRFAPRITRARGQRKIAHLPEPQKQITVGA